jgi:glutathione S-transferase/GST-like protein
MSKLVDGQNPPELLKLNPLGQVPALLSQDGILMTESAAISIWIADMARNRDLAPAIEHPNRAKYLRLMLFMASNCYMTALRYYYSDRYTHYVSHALGIQAKAREDMFREWTILSDILSEEPFLLGAKMSAADVYLSMIISWEEDADGFGVLFPNLAALNKRVVANQIIADVWKKNNF